MSDQRGMLAPYRVLDLSGEAGQPCGKLLADLGADVIKVEPPAGDPARWRGSFIGDQPDPEQGLFWLAYNANKRGVTLDLEEETDRGRFKRLVASADLVLESFTPGYLNDLGLGYDALTAINAGIVLVSITPFGQTGPHSDYVASDVVTWAMSGLMSVAGAPDGPPAFVGDNAQSYCAGSGEAAMGALLALEQRHTTGRGQHVDVSLQEAMIRTSFQVASSWDMTGENLSRHARPTPSKSPWVWRCRDGYVVWVFGLLPGTDPRETPFFDWLRQIPHGASMLALDWDRIQPETITDEDWEAIVAALGDIFARYTKAELYEAALGHGFTLVPSATTEETLANEQLASRDFWTELEHSDLERMLRYPGPFAKATLTPPRVLTRAPRLGEHNAEILADLPDPNAPAAATSTPAEAGARGPMPLAGVKVADFSWWMVGPVTVKPLADYGADVVHVESSVRVDSLRTPGPFKDGIEGVERCGDYAHMRTSQRSITIDISKPEGLEVARRLVAWADIVIDNFAAGTMERLGLGYEAIRAINPDAIVLSCSGQGQDGPHRGSKGGGGGYAALAGFNELTGWPDGEPGYLSTYTDFIAPRFNVALLLAALDYRRRTGHGQWFDVSQYEAAMHWLAPILLEYAANRRVATRQGNRLSHAAPHGVFPCRDGRWCAIAVTSEEQWTAFRTALGDFEWASEERFATLEARKQHEDELDARVAEWTRDRSPEGVMQTLQAVGVPAGAVQRGEELLDHDPQLRHRSFWLELDHPVIGPHRVPQHAFRLSEAPCEPGRARLTGEDTDEVLREVLGLTDAEVAELAMAGVLQ